MCRGEETTLVLDPLKRDRSSISLSRVGGKGSGLVTVEASPVDLSLFAIAEAGEKGAGVVVDNLLVKELCTRRMRGSLAVVGVIPGIMWILCAFEDEAEAVEVLPQAGVRNLSKETSREADRCRRRSETFRADS